MYSLMGQTVADLIASLYALGTHTQTEIAIIAGKWQPEINKILRHGNGQISALTKHVIQQRDEHAAELVAELRKLTDPAENPVSKKMREDLEAFEKAYGPNAPADQ